MGNGIYKEQVQMIAGLSLMGMGADSCIIDISYLAGVDPVAIEMQDSCLLESFQILASQTSTHNGVGVYMRDSSKGSVIKNNHILYTDMGAWITEGKIKNNIFTKIGRTICVVNDLSHQYIANIDSNYISFYFIGIQVLANTIVSARNNIFLIEFYYGGRILVNDGLSNSPNPNFVNNIVLNSAYDVISENAIYNAYPGEFINNVFMAKFETVFNTAPSIIKNNVIIGSQNAVYGSGSTVQYNNFWNVNNYPNDSTNISAYPFFVNDTSDYHLQMYSPMIDAGDPAILDKDGSRSDIGAYGGPYGESYIYQDLPPNTPVNFYAGMDSGYIHLTWKKNIEPDFKSYRIYRDTAAGTHNMLIELNDTAFTDKISSTASRLYYKVSAVDSQGNESNPTPEIIFFLSEVDDKQILMDDYILYQNYPNPFNPSTKIGYRLNRKGYVKIYVYDITGSELGVLVNEVKEPGYYETEFIAENLASGIYLYKIQVTDTEKKIPVFTEIKRMVLIK